MFINDVLCILLTMCYCFQGSASTPALESSQTRSHRGPQYHPGLCQRGRFSSLPFIMVDLGTSVISHRRLIVQGAERPEYQVEDLLQGGCDNFDVTTVDSPDAAAPPRAGLVEPHHTSPQSWRTECHQLNQHQPRLE